MIGRRQILAGGAAAVCVAVGSRLAGQTPNATLARLAAMTISPSAQVVIVTDRANSRWRRVDRLPVVPQALRFRSRDRYRATGAADPADGGWWVIDEPVLRTVHAGGRPGVDRDSSGAIQAVLDAAAALGRQVDDQGDRYRVDRSVTLPTGVTWRNSRLQAGSPGMNVVLIGSSAQFLDFEITGTGTISRAGSSSSEMHERGVYPATDGLRDAVIRGRISRITVGVHLQPLTGSGPAPSGCTIDVDLQDIVGRPDLSEGYGVLLSPAAGCTVRVRARTIQRHAVYLSAGASGNVVEADVTGCYQDAVTIYSLANQPPCEGNRLTVAARGVRVPAGRRPSSNSACFSIYGKARSNVATVTADATGPDGGAAAYAAAVVRGLEGSDGPFPEGNALTVVAKGLFSGPYVVECVDGVETLITGGQLTGRGTVGTIGFADTRQNRRIFSRAGLVKSVQIDGLDSEGSGLVVATERSPVEIADDVRFARVGAQIRDYTGKGRRVRAPRRG